MSELGGPKPRNPKQKQPQTLKPRPVDPFEHETLNPKPMWEGKKAHVSAPKSQLCKDADLTGLAAVHRMALAHGLLDFTGFL